MTARRRGALLLLALGLGGAAGCRHADRARADRTAALAACTDALARAGAAPLGEQIEQLARGCPATCPGLAAWLHARDSVAWRPGVLEARGDAPDALLALLAGCHPGCALDGALAGLAPSERWPAVLARCDDGALPLPRDQPAVVSEEGVVLTDTARWIDRAARAGVSDAQVVARLERVSGAATFTLPLPAVAGAPTARFHATSRARQFVVIGDDVRVGVVPHARLRGGRVEQLELPGTYPGQPVALDQLATVLADHAAALAARQLAPPAAPIVVADGRTPAAYLFDVVTRLGVDRAEVAVAGETIGAHPVTIERRGMNVALPEIDLDDQGITLRGFGDDRRTDWAHLDAELDNFSAVNAPIRALELHAPPGTTTADLVRILDACVVARVSAIAFIPTGP